MDEITIKDVLISVGENINPARDLVGSDDVKSDTLEFLLVKNYFENLGELMKDYLATTSVGDLIRKARGTQELPRSTGAFIENLVVPAGQPNAGKIRDLS
jgi:Rrf2 family iron-sulfur cluster assembly transcriptional regulator